MCKHAVKKLLFVVKYILDQCKALEMCNKAILENDGILKSVSDCMQK